MSQQCVTYSSSVYLPIHGCQTVALCLDANIWSSRVVNGFPFVFATVSNTGRFLGSLGNSFVPPWENPRGEEHYQYEFCYDDTQLNIDPGTGNPYLITCDDINSIIDSCVASAVTNIEGGGGGGDAITLAQEVVTSCGVTHEFRQADNTLVHTIVQSDKRLVTQVGHGLGLAGVLRPVKPGVTVGTYALASYTNNLDVACHVAVIVDADSFYLLDSGFHVIAGHGYPLGVQQSGAAGTFVSAITLDAVNDYIQNAFKAETDDCVYVSLEEAQQPIQACCLIQNITAHGFSVGDIIKSDGGGAWTLAVAGAPAAVMVIEVYDADNIQIGTNGCLTGLAGVSGGVDYAVSPSVAGTIVDATTLVEPNAIHPVGISPVDGCLIINMVNTFVTVGAAGGGGGGEFFNTSFEGDDVTCGVPAAGILTDPTEDGNANPYDSGMGVTNAADSNDCVWQQDWIVGVTEGWRHGTAIEVTPASRCFTYSFDFGVSANMSWGSGVGSPTVNDVDFVKFETLDGSFNPIATYPQIKFALSKSGSIAIVWGDGNGGDVFHPSVATTMVAGKWYRFSGTITGATKGNADGAITLDIDELQGDTATGSDGTVVANITSQSWTAMAGPHALATADTYGAVNIGGWRDGMDTAAIQELYFDNFIVDLVTC